jgi:hypothetical protein
MQVWSNNGNGYNYNDYNGYNAYGGYNGYNSDNGGYGQSGWMNNGYGYRAPYTSTPSANASLPPLRYTLPAKAVPKAANRKYYPDFVAIAPSSFYIDVRNGHKLLRFPTAIGNAGPGNLQIRGRVVGTMTQGTQEILDDYGRVIETKDVGTFTYHPTHGHFHVPRVATYELRRGGPDGEFIASGRKVGFCMEDSVRIRAGTERARVPDCSPTLQGITRGFADVYSASLAEQTFDLTNLSSGEYAVVIHLNPMHNLLETNPNNNTAWVRFRYDAGEGKVYKEADYP